MTYITECISEPHLQGLAPASRRLPLPTLLSFSVRIKTPGWKSRAEAILVLQWHLMEAIEWSLGRKPGAAGGRWQASLTPFSTRVGRNQKPAADNTTSPHMQAPARDLLLITEEWWLSEASSFTEETLQHKGHGASRQLWVQPGQEAASRLNACKQASGNCSYQ